MSSTRALAYTGLFAALIAVGAFVTIPLGPVPFTLQVLFVLLAGLVLGPRLGSVSVLVYLTLGLFAPVYHGGTSGIAVLAGPTGGYLFGFVLAAMVAGQLGRRASSATLLVLASLVALIPMYAVGAAWLAVALHATDYSTIIAGGVLQFLPFDALKALAAALAARSLLSLPLGLPAPERDR